VNLYLPEPLDARHKLDSFTSGVTSVDSWLTEHAVRNHSSGASRVFVAADDTGNVFAYYSLSAGSILRNDLPRAQRRGTPSTIPVVLLGQFGVDQHYQGRGIGATILQDALMRCARVAQDAGFMFVLVHPDGDEAEGFWKRFGFVPAPTVEPALILPATKLPTQVPGR
jgi:GNAT superfamily N-acetyltransferase